MLFHGQASTNAETGRGAVAALGMPIPVALPIALHNDGWRVTVDGLGFVHCDSATPLQLALAIANAYGSNDLTVNSVHIARGTRADLDCEVIWFEFHVRDASGITGGK